MEKAEKNSYAIKKATSLIIKALRSKKVIFTCGNGGSASQQRRKNQSDKAGDSH